MTLPRLPFVVVPRAVYDQMVRSLDDERTRTRKLTRMLMRMKITGATLLPRSTQGLRVTPRTPDELDEAIENNRYANRPAIRQALERYKERELQKGTPRKEIESVLLTWNTVNRPSNDDDDDTDGDVIEMAI